ncbi:hypothetical protein VTO42DRAFT_7566 [Malbranchea cinnamomea]
MIPPTPTTTTSLFRREDERPAFCDPSAFEWTILAFIIVCVSLSWWVYEIPTIFRRGGIRQFILRLSWQAIRVHSPVYVAHCVLTHRHDPGDWAVMYYFGADFLGREHSETIPEADLKFSIWRYVRIVLYEVPTVVAAILCAYQWSNHGPDVRVFRPVTGSWISACIPPMVVGATLLIASRMGMGSRWKSRRDTYMISSYLAIVVALAVFGVAYALGIYFGPPRSDPEVATRGTDMALVVTYYVLVTIPFPLLPIIRRQPLLQVVLCLPGVMVRVYGLALNLTGLGSKIEPPCTLQHRRLQGFSIAFGVLGFLATFVGIILCQTLCAARSTVRQAAATADETDGGHVPLQQQPAASSSSPPPALQPSAPSPPPPQQPMPNPDPPPYAASADTEALLSPPPPYPLHDPCGTAPRERP